MASDLAGSERGPKMRLGAGRTVPLPILLAVLVLAISSVVVVGAARPWTPSGPAPAAGRTAPASLGSCALLVSNASLNATYLGIYQGVANLSYVPGPNDSPPAGQSAYPPPSVGEPKLIRSWNSICTSPAFQALEATWGATGSFGPGFELAATGHYQVFFDFEYFASCSNATDPSTGECGWIVEWTVDLVTGVTSGPNLMGPEVPTGGAPPA